MIKDSWLKLQEVFCSSSEGLEGRGALGRSSSRAHIRTTQIVFKWRRDDSSKNKDKFPDQFQQGTSLKTEGHKQSSPLLEVIQFLGITKYGLCFNLLDRDPHHYLLLSIITAGHLALYQNHVGQV